VLPLFNEAELFRQPAAVVDTGSGDGTLLVELHRAIAAHTRRGRHLADYPLVMVGAEFNALAQAATAARLQEAGIPHLTVFGDIGDPASLAKTLERHGLDPHQVLHVSKSVIHNRAYRPPGIRGALPSWEPLSQFRPGDSANQSDN
jgi:hypothetical protein